MTGQSLLDRMELLNQELQLQAGEADVVRGLLALNVAQDLFEAEAAQVPNILGSATSDVTTTSNTEYTAFPAGLLRIDGMDYLDPTTSRPAWPLRKVKGTGMHPYVLTPAFAVVNGGAPAGYWTNGTRIYWAPLPSGTHTVRIYGLSAAADITASGTFAYPDVVALPLAVLAGRLMKIGVDDPTTELAGMAQTVVGSVIKTLGNFNRDGASPLRYEYSHES